MLSLIRTMTIRRADRFDEVYCGGRSPQTSAKALKAPPGADGPLGVMRREADYYDDPLPKITSCSSIIFAEIDGRARGRRSPVSASAATVGAAGPACSTMADHDISADRQRPILLSKARGGSGGLRTCDVAREAILARGGAPRCNVFTRLGKGLDFEGDGVGRVPAMPIRAFMLLPRWFVSSGKKSLYCRETVIVPLLILMDVCGPRRGNPRGFKIRRAFPGLALGRKTRRYAIAGVALGRFFLGLDRVFEAGRGGIFQSRSSAGSNR